MSKMWSRTYKYGGCELADKMTLNDYNSQVTRVAWDADNGSTLIAVTGLLQAGEYEIEKRTNDDGNIILECEPQEDKQ